MTEGNITKVACTLCAIGIVGCVAMYGDVRSMKAEIVELRQKKTDDAQDNSIAWLVARCDVQYDRLNLTREQMKPPLYTFPYADKRP